MPERLIAEFDGTNGALKKEYLAGGGAAITIEPTNGTRYLTSDTLGSPRVVTNSSGAVVSRHDYLPFGQELFAGTGGRTTGMGYSAADNLRQKFTGQQRDTETGLDYFNARYYSSGQGRFTSPDPFAGSATIADPQTFNRYAYVGNNPLTQTDPTGLSAGSGEGGSLPDAPGALGRVHPGGGLDPMFGSSANHPNHSQQAALNELDALARQADKDGYSDLAAGLRTAKAQIASAISALRPGEQSVGVNVALNAILNVGNSKEFSNDSTITVKDSKGNQFTIGPGNKCNILPAYAHGVGAGLDFIQNGQSGRGYPLTEGDVPPAANYLGDKNDTQHLANLPIVKDGTLRIGDIVAWRKVGGVGTGHSSIYIGGGVVVYAGADRVRRVPIAQTLKYVNNWATRGWFGTSLGLEHEPYVVRRYGGPR